MWGYKGLKIIWVKLVDYLGFWNFDDIMFFLVLVGEISCFYYFIVG